ncbi:MAG: hypothetical protein AAF699_18020 [Pseudomonadota bacterium]
MQPFAEVHTPDYLDYLSCTWMDSAKNWEIALWGRNLTNKEFRTHMFKLTDLIGADQVMRGVPLTYGVDIRYVD